MIEVKNIIKKYGDKKVVDDFTLTIPKNKIIGFIGSNGAGKSTLVSIVTRIIEKNSGQVFVTGKEIEKWESKELAKKLSILSQQNNTNVKITVRELINFGRFPYSHGKLTEEDHKIVDEVIEYLDLGAIQDSFIDELSGGQKQMAFIAMIVAQDTEYIFLDEPLNNLDMNHSVEMMKVLQRLVKEKNKTIIVVIHDINYVSHYADYIIAMKDGKLISYGETEDIINKKELRKIFDMDIEVEKINGKNVCLYY